MVYSASIVTAAGGTEAGAAETFLKVTRGLVWLFEVDFPPGCCGLAHLRVFDGSYQVFPATPGESFHGDNTTIHLDDLYYKQEGPMVLRLVTWNTDERWDHELQVRVGMAMTRAEMSRYIPALSFDNFEQVLAESIARQEVMRQGQLEEAVKLLNPE